MKTPVFLMLTVLWAELTPIDPMSGGAGWVGAGLLGAVLYWLMFVRLPATDKQILSVAKDKDEQIKALLEAAANEREREREARHKVADKAQEIVMTVAGKFEATLKEVREQHRLDAEQDRAAFMEREAERNSRIEDAIKLQTAQLTAAIMAGCRFAHVEK